MGTIVYVIDHSLKTFDRLRARGLDSMLAGYKAEAPSVVTISRTLLVSHAVASNAWQRQDSTTSH